MVRLERRGDVTVFITGTKDEKGVESLIDALIECRSILSSGKISEGGYDKLNTGIRYLDNTLPVKLRDELRAELKKAMKLYEGTEKSP